MKTIIYLLLFATLACNKPDRDELSIQVRIPNAFRPRDIDGTSNDVADCVDGSTHCNGRFMAVLNNPNNIPFSFDMQIYTKTNVLVFKSSNHLEGWDGTDQNKGDDFLPQGNYRYRITVTELTSDKKSHTWEGELALLR